MKIDIKPVLNKGAIAVKERAPEILVYTGIGGTVVSGVMACKATRNLDEVLNQHKANAEVVHKKYEVVKDERGKKRDLTRVYARTCLGLVRLYGPSVTVGMLSIISILTGNNILRKRNIALAAAYATIDTSFKQYRDRVIDRFGEEVDRELRTGGRQEKIEVVERDENGKEKKIKKNATVVDNLMPSDYARYFGLGYADGAEPNSGYNLFFLRSQQELANHMLKAYGRLFLNDVYDMLGYERSVAGQAVGWVYDKNSEDHGDNYIDFGIQEVYLKKGEDPGEYEKVFLLDFNVDGNILDHALSKGLLTN